MGTDHVLCPAWAEAGARFQQDNHAKHLIYKHLNDFEIEIVEADVL